MKYLILFVMTLFQILSCIKGHWSDVLYSKMGMDIANPPRAYERLFPGEKTHQTCQSQLSLIPSLVFGVKFAMQPNSHHLHCSLLYSWSWCDTYQKKKSWSWCNLYSFIYGTCFLFFFLAGFNVETVEYKNISFTVWDVGGQDKVSNNCNKIAPFNSCCSFLGLYKCLT